MLRERTLAWRLMLLTLFFVSGCGAVVTKIGDDDEPEAPTTPTFAISTEDAAGNPQEKEFNTFDAALIEKEVRAIDWTDAKLNAHVELDRGDRGALSIYGVLNSTDDDEKLVADWFEEVKGKIIQTGRVSEPIDSVDTVVAMLVSYHNDDGKFKTLVKWRD